MDGWYWLLLTLVLAVVLVVLWKKGIISKSDVSGMRDAVEQLVPLLQGKGVFEKIVLYAMYAFHAAEQLMRTGEITAEERKKKALELVQTYANLDNVELTRESWVAADAVIEAHCDMKGHGAPEATLLKDVFSGTELPVDLEVSQWNEEQLRSFCEANGIDITGCETVEQIITRMGAVLVKQESLYVGNDAIPSLRHIEECIPEGEGLHAFCAKNKIDIAECETTAQIVDRIAAGLVKDDAETSPHPPGTSLDE